MMHDGWRLEDVVANVRCIVGGGARITAQECRSDVFYLLRRSA